MPYHHGRDHGVHAASHELTRWVKPTRSRSRIRLWKGEWSFFAFRGGAPVNQIPYAAPCYPCHEAHCAADMTFVQFYPILLPITAGGYLPTHSSSVHSSPATPTIRARLKAAAIQLRWIVPKYDGVRFECENGFHSLMVVSRNHVSSVSQHGEEVCPQGVVRIDH